ncbi:PAS domain S-box-containing protein [Pedobacter terrae]|uniref:Sensory/regulatory protein RpfC n=1 Tax=Pedobacter terrae TaxID=405671 RepID=A0A1G7TVS3_9SPHI|nr:ATP-binding protein [Pedobacter terrae]SDG39395.1 PAS domain S-box-containing protein [Pedobacter terrae]
MNTLSLSFNYVQLNRLFPYFILVDQNMKILHIGDKLKSICRECQYENLTVHFDLPQSMLHDLLVDIENLSIGVRQTGGKIRGRWERPGGLECYFFAGESYDEYNTETKNEKDARQTTDIPGNTLLKTIPSSDVHYLDAIVGNMGFGFIEMDLEGRIRYANARFSEMSGYAIALMLNQTPDLLFGNKFFSKDDVYSDQINAGLQEVVFTDAQGKQRLWLAGRALKYNERNENTGWVITCFDFSGHQGFEQEFITAKKDAEKGAGIKAMFLANISHEIRTPMNAIMSMTGLLSKTTLTEDQEYYLQTIQTASESLLVIIDDILDLSKIDAGKLKLEHIGFSLTVLFDDVLQAVSHKAVKRGLELNYFPPKDGTIAPTLMGDPYRITQVVLNLMTNAIKFTEKGSVELTVLVLEDTPDDQEIEILVKDTGIGMDPEFLSHLFDDFSQEFESETRKYGGTGLGMGISQKLVSQMGGYFKVKSQKGLGSEISFVIRLQKGQLADVPEQVSVHHHEDLFAGRRFLIVDDNEMNRLVASTILLAYGPQIMIAENGQEALDMLTDEAYDIILMDIQMPVLNGYDTSKALRKRGYTGTIIALTASAIEGEREKCIAAGMDDYITKPINETLLVNLIDNWIQKTADAVVAPDNDLPLYSLDGLRTISKGREDFVTKMIEMFCAQIPDTLLQLNQASAKGDLEQLSKLAHKLKSTIDHLAILPLQRTIREIEAAAEGNVSATELAEMIAAVNNVLNQVMSELNEEIAVRNGG